MKNGEQVLVLNALCFFTKRKKKKSETTYGLVIVVADET